MIEVIVLFVLGIIWITFASLQDVKEHEVANWLNFSLIVFALGFRFFYSLFFDAGFGFFYQGLIGLGIFFILGNLLYYSHFFAGGDAKMLVALGTIIPFSSNFNTNINYFMVFLLIFLFIGAVYGLSNALYYSSINWKSCKKEFKKQFNKNKRIVFVTTLLAILFLVFSFFSEFFFYLGLMVFFFPYLYLYAKSIDEACMIKSITPKVLREGDWLYKDLRFGKNFIEAKWDGLTKKEIQLIKKSKLKEIQIRVGIAFIPVFLMSFILFGILYFSEKIALLFLF